MKSASHTRSACSPRCSPRVRGVWVGARRSLFPEGERSSFGTIAKGSWASVVAGRRGTVAEIVRVTMFRGLPDDYLDALDDLRTLADRVGVGKDTVARVWLQSRTAVRGRWSTFKILQRPPLQRERSSTSSGSTCPLPSGPWSSASTKRPRSEALDRTQPSLPMTKGRAGTFTHDYKRNGYDEPVRGDERGRPVRSSMTPAYTTPPRTCLRFLQAHRPPRREKTSRSTSCSTIYATHKAPPVAKWLA